MSPSSSTNPQSGKAPRSQPHSRKASATAVPQQASTTASRSAKQTSADPTPDAKTPRRIPAHYTVFIRLPFPRNDFEDPPPVDWNSAKDRQLWKLISSASNSKDLDWEAMSERFEVPLSFLLQQAAWLYERHFEGMRAQMKRLGSVASAAPSPRPEAQQGESGSVGGVSMQRKGSNGTPAGRVLACLAHNKPDPTAPPSINTQRSLQTAGDAGSSPATPRSSKPLLSRNPSTNTVTQSRVHGSSPRQGSLRAFRGSSGSQRRPPPPVQNIESSQEGDNESALSHDGASESESEEDRSALARSKVTRRPPLGKKQTTAGGESDGDAEDDDDESSGEGYLPFAAASKPAKDDPAATLKGSPKRQNATPYNTGTSSKSKTKAPPPESSESSASSAQPPPSSTESPASRTDTASTKAPRGPLSPKQRAQLEKLSPRYKKHSGSEGSPSMGSSFSDLDELSVTQSALEEALMSNMQHAGGSVGMGMGSRMSSLRDALSRRQEK